MNRLLKEGPASQRHTGYPARATAIERPLKGRASREAQSWSGGDSHRPSQSWEASDQRIRSEAPPSQRVAFFTSGRILAGAADLIGGAG